MTYVKIVLLAFLVLGCSGAKVETREPDTSAQLENVPDSSVKTRNPVKVDDTSENYLASLLSEEQKKLMGKHPKLKPAISTVTESSTHLYNMTCIQYLLFRKKYMSTPEYCGTIRAMSCPKGTNIPEMGAVNKNLTLPAHGIHSVTLLDGEVISYEVRIMYSGEEIEKSLVDDENEIISWIDAEIRETTLLVKAHKPAILLKRSYELREYLAEKYQTMQDDKTSITLSLILPVLQTSKWTMNFSYNRKAQLTLLGFEKFYFQRRLFINGFTRARRV